jgi:hypothetical protein
MSNPANARTTIGGGLREREVRDEDSRVRAGGSPVKYMLLIYSREEAWKEGEREDCFEESTRLAQELHSKGQYLGASPSSPSPAPPACECGKEAARDRRPLRGNPRAVGGFFLIDAKDSTRPSPSRPSPRRRKGTVEVRPVLNCRTCRRFFNP